MFAARLRLSEYEARRLVGTSVALGGRLSNTRAALEQGDISWRLDLPAHAGRRLLCETGIDRIVHHDGAITEVEGTRRRMPTACSAGR